MPSRGGEKEVIHWLFNESPVELGVIHYAAQYEGWIGFKATVYLAAGVLVASGRWGATGVTPWVASTSGLLFPSGFLPTSAVSRACCTASGVRLHFQPVQ